ncbi:MAG: serine hydrolase domain-containing protein [Vicinamibacterales bacterium]
MRSRRALVIPLLTCLLAAPTLASVGQQTSGIAADFSAALDALQHLPRLRSVLVSHNGELLLERYFGGAHATRPANIKSAAKSVLSALIGIAIDRRLLPGVEQPIGTYFPDLLSGEANRTKRAITIENLLTMRSGLEPTSNRHYGAWVQSPHWIRHVLSRKLLAPPGTSMDYSTGNSHVLSAILTRATGTSTWQFADRHLGRPLGFALPRWPQDPQGIYFGGNDMLMTPRQMVAFGELYLRRGLVEQTRVLSEAWIRESLVPRTTSAWSGQSYGYGWWIRPVGGYDSFHAWGFGGQYIFVVPALDLVVVTTSSPEPVALPRRSASRPMAGENARRIHRRTVDAIVDQLIVPAVAMARSH